MPSKQILIEQTQKKLRQQFNGVQRWWYTSLFHFTNIDNAISILNEGRLLSRNKALSSGVMKNDNANSDVISKTSKEYKDYARLYFGPSTPTQYNNEGFKPKSEIYYGAHCPIPIMFLFNFKKVFMLDNVKFTDGNLATNPNVYSDIEYLQRLDFSLIYHRSSFNQEQRDRIINARHSEVLVKDFLELDNYLERIIVRSEAEKNTLLYQLDSKLRNKYELEIINKPPPNIFINRWLYINRVFIDDAGVLVIDWHHCENMNQCQYNLKIIFKNLTNNEQSQLLKTNWYPNNALMKIKLPNGLFFKVELFIDEHLAYKNRLDYIPF